MWPASGLWSVAPGTANGRRPAYPRLPQLRIPGGRAESEVSIRAGCCHPASWRAVQEPDLNQKGLVHVLDGVLLFTYGSGNAVDANGSAAELVDDGAQQLAINIVEPVLI